MESLKHYERGDKDLCAIDRKSPPTHGCRMIRRRFFFILPACLLPACGVSHGPVSGGTLARLHAQAVTPGEGARMMDGRRLATRSHPPGAAMRVRMGRDGARLPTVASSINGRRAEPLLLDTGATVTVLDAAMAVRGRVATVPDVKPEMAGVMGRESGMAAVIQALQIGGWRLDNLPCIVRLQRSSGGLDFIGNDFSISVLGFHLARQHCSYLTLDYPGSVVEFGFRGTFRGPSSRRHCKAPYTLRNGVPMARVTVGNVSWDAIVDTGSCFGVEIDQALAQRIGHGTGGSVVRGDFVMVGVGGVVTPQQAGVRVIQVPRLKMLGSTFNNAQVEVMPGPARIGSYFLQNYRVTFDFRRQVVWLEW